MADQHLFAELSGDYNPMHLDPVHARRTIFGSVVVHGVHGLLWALDCWFRERHLRAVTISHLWAKFSKPILVDQKGAVHVREENGDEFLLSIEANGQLSTLIRGRLGASSVGASCPRRGSERGPCVDWKRTDAAVTRGKLPLGVDAELLRRLFPALAQCLPTVQVAEILSTTRLVGMVCPGLRSVFVSLDLQAYEGGAGMEVAYGIERSAAPLVDLTVTGPTLQGRLRTLVRPRPEPQLTMGEVRIALGDVDFSGQRAIVVGGSRGLGEVTAKCIAAGGGAVLITYVRGEDDARRVVAEIVEDGGSADAIFLDCLEVPSHLEEHLARFGVPTHLYYFATPMIPVNPNRVFYPADFRMMSQYYVEGFASLVQALHPLASAGFTVFYPSTIFLTQPKAGLGEYCAAKAAGEAVCAHLGTVLPGLRIVTPRLPRMRTDQTASLIPLKTQEPLAVMAELLREIGRPAVTGSTSSSPASARR